MNLRSPIIVVLGHVDAGKTSLLDKIRNTNLIKYEPGAMTQHIGATEIPIDVIKEMTKDLSKIFNFEIKIPSLLFLDTPGHEAFTNLRKRGGSVADFAIIVVDILEGFQQQTYEAIEICKEFKVPFLIALNKLDMLEGWKSMKQSFLENLKYQDSKTLALLDEKVYNIVVKLYELGFESERIDRVKDFRKQVAIIPVSAKTGEGIPELLITIAGLAQRFLEEKLKINVEGPGKGVILEVKEEKGYGHVIDVILYDGKIKKGDNIVFLSKSGIKTSKIRAILKPKPLQDIRFQKTKFIEINEVYAASGIRIAAEGLEDAIPGSEVYVYYNDEELNKLKEELKSNISQIIFKTDNAGIILKADTLGSLEAIINILKKKNINIAKADIGNIDKDDIDLLLSLKDKYPEYSFIAAFNVKACKSVEDLIKNNNIKIISGDLIYKFIEDIENEILERKKRKHSFEIPTLGKIKILRGFVFRRSNPAIVGIEVLEGEIKKDVLLINSQGKIIGKILSIQEEKKSLDIAKKGDKVAISIENGVVGRNIEEDEILYTYITEDQYIKCKNNKEILNNEQINILREIAQIMRKDNPLWGTA